MFVALLHAGPTLIAEASAEQKAAHLPAILRGDQVWCQGFSEPQAGSDLASLRTRAVRDGDEYVVNGSKIWTSNAQVADYCELLVRTDTEAPKHKGISWLILPMDTPGIDIRPLRSIPGTDEFSEVFFDDVRVPVANRVGDENDGWRVAMVTFSFERGTAFVSEMLASMQLVEQLAATAKKVTRGSGTAWDDAGLRRDIGRAAADLDALWALVKRNVTQATHSGVPGPGGSVFKLYYSEMRHRLGALSERVFERAGLALDDVGDLRNGPHVEGMLHAISISIAAGTTQIQRNIVAERILGLPKDR
jgi:alkylation response protein AidB-like acyl-CoA dehydrogenase